MRYLYIIFALAVISLVAMMNCHGYDWDNNHQNWYNTPKQNKEIDTRKELIYGESRNDVKGYTTETLRGRNLFDKDGNLKGYQPNKE